MEQDPPTFDGTYVEKLDTSRSSASEDGATDPKTSDQKNLEAKENGKGDRNSATPNTTRPAMSKKRSRTPLRTAYAQPVLDASKIEGKKSSIEDRITSAKGRRLQQQKQLELDLRTRREKEGLAREKWVQSLDDKRRKSEENKLKDDNHRREVEQRKKQRLEDDKRRAEAKIAHVEKAYDMKMRQKRCSSMERGRKRWSWGENNEEKSTSLMNLSGPTSSKQPDRFSGNPLINSSQMAFVSGLRSYGSHDRLNKGTSPGRPAPSVIAEPLLISPRLLAPTRASLARSRNAINDLDDTTPQSVNDSKHHGPMRSRSVDRRKNGQVTPRSESSGTSPRSTTSTPRLRATPPRGTSPIAHRRRSPPPAGLQSLLAPTASSERKKTSSNTTPIGNVKASTRGVSPQRLRARPPASKPDQSPDASQTRKKRTPSPVPLSKAFTKRLQNDSPKSPSTPPSIKQSLYPSPLAKLKPRSSPAGTKTTGTKSAGKISYGAKTARTSVTRSKTAVSKAPQKAKEKSESSSEDSGFQDRSKPPTVNASSGTLPESLSNTSEGISDILARESEDQPMKEELIEAEPPMQDETTEVERQKPEVTGAKQLMLNGPNEAERPMQTVNTDAERSIHDEVQAQEEIIEKEQSMQNGFNEVEQSSGAESNDTEPPVHNEISEVERPVSHVATEQQTEDEIKEMDLSTADDDTEQPTPASTCEVAGNEDIVTQHGVGEAENSSEDEISEAKGSDIHLIQDEASNTEDSEHNFIYVAEPPSQDDANEAEQLSELVKDGTDETELLKPMEQDDDVLPSCGAGFMMGSEQNSLYDVGPTPHILDSAPTDGSHDTHNVELSGMNNQIEEADTDTVFAMTVAPEDAVDDALEGAADESSLEVAVDDALEGTANGALEVAVDNALDGAVDDELEDDASDTQENAVNNALEDTLEDTLEGAAAVVTESTQAPAAFLENTPEEDTSDTADDSTEDTIENASDCPSIDATQGTTMGSLESVVLDALEGTVGDTLEAASGDTLEGAIVDAPEIRAEDSAEDAEEDPLEGANEGTLEGAVTDAPEIRVEDNTDKDASEGVVGTLDGASHARLESTAEGALEGIVTDAAENAKDGGPVGILGDTLEGAMDDTLEDNAESNPEYNVKDTTEGSVTSEDVKVTLEDGAEDTPEGTVKVSSEGALDDTPEGALDDTPEGALDDTPEGAVEDTLENAGKDAIEECSENTEGAANNMPESGFDATNGALEGTLEGAAEDTLHTTVIDSRGNVDNGAPLGADLFPSKTDIAENGLKNESYNRADVLPQSDGMDCTVTESFPNTVESDSEDDGNVSPTQEDTEEPQESCDSFVESAGLCNTPLTDSLKEDTNNSKEEEEKLPQVDVEASPDEDPCSENSDSRSDDEEEVEEVGESQEDASEDLLLTEVTPSEAAPDNPQEEKTQKKSHVQELENEVSEPLERAVEVNQPEVASSTLSGEGNESQAGENEEEEPEDSTGVEAVTEGAESDDKPEQVVDATDSSSQQSAENEIDDPEEIEDEDALKEEIEESSGKSEDRTTSQSEESVGPVAEQQQTSESQTAPPAEEVVTEGTPKVEDGRVMTSVNESKTILERRTQPRKALDTEEDKEEYRQAIAEKRRELKERKEQEERERQERIRLAKIEQALREEEARRMFEEAAAAAENEKRMREERDREQAEEGRRKEEEEIARKREAIEKTRKERELLQQKQEGERMARRKRLEMIMRRTRQPDASSDSAKKNDDSSSPPGSLSPQHTPTSGRSPQNQSPVLGKSPLMSAAPERSASPAIAAILNRSMEASRISMETRTSPHSVGEKEQNLLNFTNSFPRHGPLKIEPSRSTRTGDVSSDEISSSKIASNGCVENGSIFTEGFDSPPYRAGSSKQQTIVEVKGNQE